MSNKDNDSSIDKESSKSEDKNMTKCCKFTFHKDTCRERATKYFRLFSVGKYQQGLYFNGRASYSTTTGGILTLIFGLILLIFTVYTLITVFTPGLNLRTLDQRAVPFSDLIASNYSIGKFHEVMDYRFYANVATRSYKSCSMVNITVTY